MAAVLPPWPYRAAATQTCVRIGGDEPIAVHLQRSDHHPRSVSVRLRSHLFLAHGLRTIDGCYFALAIDPVVRLLDHLVVVGGRDRAVLRSAETWSDLIHEMLAHAPLTAGYDLAAGNWVDSGSFPLCTPHGLATAIVSHYGEQIDEVVDAGGGDFPGLHFDIYLPGLWVSLLYSEPKALLLACKEDANAGAPAPGRKRRRRESGEPCAICMVGEEDAGDEEGETITLPCSHAFHRRCILTWFHKASTCPICRRDIMACFSFVRSESIQQWTHYLALPDDAAQASQMMSHGYPHSESEEADELIDA